MRGISKIIGALGLIAAVAATGAVPKKKAPVPREPSAVAKTVVQNCEAHRFETTIQLTGPDGQPKRSKVRMCGTQGQSDAEWIATLKDAVKKTTGNTQLPEAAKEQIVAAVNAEIDRLSAPPSRELNDGAFAIRRSPTSTETPLSREYSALPPLPTAPTIETPDLLGANSTTGGSASAARVEALPPSTRLTLRCAAMGDPRPSPCDRLDSDTIFVLRADVASPDGVSLRFLRKGDVRWEQQLPPLKAGQSAMVHLPPAVCAGVAHSRIEIEEQASGQQGPKIASLGQYELYC
jgi:hypothetical protein